MALTSSPIVKHSLRTRLLRSYAAIIIVLLSLLSAFVIVHFSVVREYKTISDTMIVEYRLLDQVPSLIDAYNKAFKSIDSNNNLNTDEVVRVKNEIHLSLSYLDAAIVDEDSKNDYIGLKNTIESLERKIDSGIQDLKNGKVNTATSYYDAANKENVFVRTNAITLILNQLKYTASLQQQIDSTYTTALYLAAALFVVTLTATAFYVRRFARKLTDPLQYLNMQAQRIAGGDFSSQIEVSSDDELGELATAFNKMLVSLRSSYLRLALEKERDETLLESMNEGMIALDNHGKIVLINSVASSTFGLDPNTKDVSFLDTVPLLSQQGKVIPPETLPTSALQTGEIVDSVYMFRENETHKVLLNVSASPIKIEGRVAGAILVIRDVTKEKEVDRMKTEFISLASHQLRTPLSAIKWFSEMLLNGDAGELKPEQKEFTKNISDSTNRMVDLVNSLLNISRIESGRIIVDPKPTDLKELIGGIVNDLKAKTEERQQTLIISVHSELPKINLDSRLIGQVYLNLLTNAVKYTPKNGEISVTVSKKGEDVISQVTDNGYGIPKAQQGRIFEKFFRAENVAKFETDGTGLGLYLIKAVVESSGGKIWFESEEGKGTSFWFTLPLSGMKAKEGEVTLDV
jgi:signal transduction histidine kinase